LHAGAGLHLDPGHPAIGPLQQQVDLLAGQGPVMEELGPGSGPAERFPHFPGHEGFEQSAEQVGLPDQAIRVHAQQVGHQAGIPEQQLRGLDQALAQVA
jgi:hypothetical protein